MSPVLVQVLLFVLSLASLLVLLRQINPFSKSRFSVRICIAIVCVGCFSISFVMLWTSLSYQVGGNAAVVATVTSHKDSDQSYSVNLEFLNGQSSNYKVLGDMWQLDFRLLVWSDFWQHFGLHTLYQPDRLSGRYAKVDEELNKQRTVYDLSKRFFGNEMHGVWVAISRLNLVPYVDAKYGGSAYVPLGDEAKYGVYILRRGVQIKPLNEAAKKKLKAW